MLREVVLLGRAGQRGGRFGGPPQDAGEQPGLRWACSAIDGPCGLLLALGDRPAAVSALLDKAAAHVYKRPLGVFFLPEPPVDFDTMRDFRRHVGAKAGEWSPDLHGEYRRALTQRESALELAEIDDAPPPTTWRLTALPTNDEALASVARDMLLSQSPLGLPGGGGTKYEHLNVWVAALEEAGVLALATSEGCATRSQTLGPRRPTGS